MSPQRLRVPLGFAYGLAFILTAEPLFLPLVAGITTGLLGLSLRLWASGHLEKSRTLALTGPYRWTRNPLYLGSFLMGIGLTAAGSQLWLITLFLGLFPAIYIPVMRREEKELEKIFGAPYAEYRRRVPLFLPRSLPSSPEMQKRSNFQWSRVILNQEYKTVAGFFILAGWVLFRL